MKDFIRGVFSDGGDPSSSRILMFIHAALGGTWVTHIVFRANGSIPDFGTMAGVTAFVTAPYAINQFRNAFGKSEAPNPPAPPAAPVP